MKLRPAGAGDLALLVSQRDDFFAAAHPFVPRPTPARFEEFLRAQFQRGGVTVAILEEDLTGAYVGSLALELEPWAWSDELALCDRWLHVRADRRGGAALSRLVRFGLALARRRGVPLYLDNGMGTGRARLLR